MTGRKASSVSVCAHHKARAASPAPLTKNAARYVTISAKMSSATRPDPQESSPSHLGRTRNRRTNRPADAHRASHGEDGGEIEIQSPHRPRGIEEAGSENRRAVVQRDQSKGAKRPEDQRMGHAGERPLADHLGLAQHLPNEIAHASADGEEVEVRVFFRLQDFAEDGPESPPEPVDRRGRQRHKQQPLPGSRSAGARPGLGEKRS